MDHHDVDSFVWEFRSAIALYRELLDKHIYPPFVDPERSAGEAASRLWSEAMSKEYVEGDGFDEGACADEANDHSQRVYQELFAMQTILMNLFTAGLFHLFEQQIGSMLHHDEKPADSPAQKKPAPPMRVFPKWAKKQFRINVRMHPSWVRIKELNSVANVVKHAEGDSEKSLRRRRPEYFNHPLRRQPAYQDLPLSSLPTRTPMAGTDVYVLKEDFDSYIASLDEFWQWFRAQAKGEGTIVGAL